MRRQASRWKTNCTSLILCILCALQIWFTISFIDTNNELRELKKSFDIHLEGYTEYKKMHIKRVMYENAYLEELSFRIREAEAMAESAYIIADTSYNDEYDWIIGLETEQVDSIYRNVPKEQWEEVASQKREPYTK